MDLKEENMTLLRKLEAYKTLINNRNNTIQQEKLQTKKSRGVIDELKNRITDKNEEIMNLQNQVSELLKLKEKGNHHKHRTSRQQHTPKQSPRHQQNTSPNTNDNQRTPKRHHTPERSPRRPSLPRYSAADKHKDEGHRREDAIKKMQRLLQYL